MIFQTRILSELVLLANISYYGNTYSSDIKNGLRLLQELVDEFNALGLESLKNKEFLDLIVDPEDLLCKKIRDCERKNKTQ